jgi:putative ABC transport system permease protein
VRQGAVLAAVGIGIGLGLAFVLSRFVGELLFDVSIADPLIFVGIPLLLAAAALVASAQPAWRASRVDPTVALRIE